MKINEYIEHTLLAPNATNEKIENLNKMETSFDCRLGSRMTLFLTKEQMEKIGYTINDDSDYPKTQIEWTEENVLKQLREDVEFGIEKATGHRGISASLMWEVCMGWCTILENGLDKQYEDDYGYYGDKLFKAIDEYYNFGLVNENTFDEKFYESW